MASTLPLVVLAKSLCDALVGLALYSGTVTSVLPRLVIGSSGAGVPCHDLVASSALSDLHKHELFRPQLLSSKITRRVSSRTGYAEGVGHAFKQQFTLHTTQISILYGPDTSRR